MRKVSWIGVYPAVTTKFLELGGEERQRILPILDEGLATRPELPDYLSIAVK